MCVCGGVGVGGRRCFLEDSKNRCVLIWKYINSPKMGLLVVVGGGVQGGEQGAFQKIAKTVSPKMGLVVVVVVVVAGGGGGEGCREENRVLFRK